ncbi:hypothetical protein [Actinomadura litoris]|uniref:hypothetical protein n=1 Tax=Actinomadura litoris TaxID=2678616 RepID=UPI001FA7D101|nr:hypothetical protein [Actinomadura litoris]
MLIISISLLMGVIAALVAGFSAKLANESVHEIVKQSSVAFGSTVGLVIVVMTAAGVL